MFQPHQGWQRRSSPQRNTQSAATSPERLRHPPLVHSSSAPELKSPPKGFPPVARRLEFTPPVPTSNGPGQGVYDITARVEKTVGALVQLKKDRLLLRKRVTDSLYSDGHLVDNVKKIKEILEAALEAVVHEAEKSSRPIWTDLAQHLKRSLKAYEAHLSSCPDRVELVEIKRCLDQMEKLLQDEDKTSCCICMDNPVNCSAACGHMLCTTCAQSVESCPICRRKILPHDIRLLFF